RSSMRGTTASSPENRSVSRRSALQDAIEGKRVLEWQLGRNVVSFAYPNGRSSRLAARALRRAGHTSLRTTTEQLNPRRVRELERLGAKVWVRGTTDAQATNWIRNAVDRQGLLVEVHHVVSDSKEYFWTTPPDAFARHVRELKASRCWIATQRDAAAYIRDRD